MLIISDAANHTLSKMAEDQSEAKLTLNIKSTKRKDSVEVPSDYTVRQVS